MPQFAPVVFPLHGIRPDGTCACGRDGCSRVGKHPAVEWAALSLGDPVPRPEAGAGVGLKTGASPKGSGIFVVDLDGEAACDWWSETEPHGETRMVQTPRGLHLYFRHPGFLVRNSVGELAKGVDIRGDGGFVVAAGSPHRSGQRYDAVNNLPPAEAPPWLLEWLRARRPAPAALQSFPGDVTDPEERAYRRELFARDCQTMPPSVQGHGGDAALFRVVQRGAYDHALPIDDVLEIVREHFDPRCSPPWGEALAERVTHKARSAKTSSTRPRNEPPPAALRDVFAPVAHGPTNPPKARVGEASAYCGVCDHDWCVCPPAPLAELPAPAKREKGIVWGQWDEEPEPIRYLVEGLIPVSTVGMLVAHGSSMKTWAALSLGLAVASGRPWLETYETRKGKVVIVDYESGLFELRRRVRMLQGSHVEDLGAWAYPEERIDEPGLWKRLATIEGITLVIVDSLAAGAPGTDENDVRAAMPLKLAARFTEASGACVLFIHHAKKDDGGDARKAVRGSTAIFADLDWCYGFENIDEGGGVRRVHMHCVKPCMGPKPEAIPLQLADSTGLTTYSEGPARIAGAEETDAMIEAAILLVLQDGAITTKKGVAKAIGRRLERVAPVLDDMCIRGVARFALRTGYELDSDELREARIVAAVRGTKLRTVSAVARVAAVKTLDVEELTRRGVIVRSQEGRFLAPERAENSAERVGTQSENT